MYVDHLRLRRSFAFARIWGSHEEHDLHVHDCLEIGVLLKHELRYRFGDRTYEGKPGDIFLCRPFEPHWSYAEPDKPFECILALFTPSALRHVPGGSRLLLPFYTAEGIPPLIPADTPVAQAISSAAIRAMEAGERQLPGWVTRQFTLLLDMLLQVADFASSQLSGTDGHVAPDADIAEVVGYILDHFREPIDGELLLQQAGMGRTGFFRDFRTLTGLSPNEFVNRIRVQHVMDQLRSSNVSMIELADESGFGSLSAFNKQFKRYAGVSPREYRQRVRE